MVEYNNPVQLGPPPTNEMRSWPKTFVRWCERMWKEKLNINRSGSEETGWTDVAVNATSFRTVGAGVPAVEAINSTIWRGLAFTDELAENNEKRIQFTGQLPHGVRAGTPINLHIHYATETAPASDQNVRWLVEYDTLNGQGDPIAAANADSEVADMPVLSRYGDYTYHVSATVPIARDTTQESTLFAVTLRRNSSNAGDTYAGNKIWILSADGHIKMEKIGSFTEFPGSLE